MHDRGGRCACGTTELRSAPLYQIGNRRDLIFVPHRVEKHIHSDLGSDSDVASIEIRTDVLFVPLRQHTDDILRTVLGLSDREIGALHQAGIVAGPAHEA